MRLILLSALVVTLATGCQSSPRMSQHVELLNAEKRMIEDELYALQFDYEELLNEVRALRQENGRLQGTSAPPTRDHGLVPSLRKPRGSGPDLRPPVVEEGTLGEPKVELPADKPPSKGASPAALPAPLPPGTRSNVPVKPAHSEANRKLGGGGIPAWSLEPADPRVTQLYLDPALTGGSNFDREPGDDGVTVVVEPRNGEGTFVPLAGPVTVVLLDPSQPGEAGRVARWEIDAQTAQQSLLNSGQRKGIELRLPWPNSRPTCGRAELFVRYGTVDGRHVEAHRQIAVTQPGQVTQRWTPRSAPRPGAAVVPPLAANAAGNDQPLGEFETPAAAMISQQAAPEWRPHR